MGSVVESISDALDDAWTTVTDEVTRWGEDISAEWKRMDPALQAVVIGAATWGAGSYLSSAGYFAGGEAATAATAATEAGAAVEVGTASIFPELGAATELSAGNALSFGVPEGFVSEGLASTQVPGLGQLSAEAMATVVDPYALQAGSASLTEAATVGGDFLAEGMIGSETLAAQGPIAIEAGGGAGLTATQAGAALATEAGISVPWETMLKGGLGLMGLTAQAGVGGGGSGGTGSPIAATSATGIGGSGSGLAVTEEQKRYAGSLVSGLQQQQSRYANLRGRG